MPFCAFDTIFPLTDTELIALSPRIKVGELVEPFRGLLTRYLLHCHPRLVRGSAYTALIAIAHTPKARSADPIPHTL